LATTALVVASVACTDAAAEAPSRLPDSFSSRDALIGAVLEALANKDEAALVGFMVTREDWEQLLWPEMPDRETTPFEFVWGMSSTNSRKGRAQAVAEYGGMSYVPISVSFTKEPEIYSSFTLHKGAQVVVRLPATGEQGVLPIFDVFVEYEGRWKLMNYDEL